MSAEDADLGDLGKVTYDLEGEYSQLFRIDATSGQITVAEDNSMLDRELTEDIHLTVVARDEAPEDTQRSARIPVSNILKYIRFLRNLTEGKKKEIC